MIRELEYLKKMRELLAKGWTPDALARNQSGRKVSVMSAKAASFCIMGAMYRSTSGLLHLLSIHSALREFNAEEISRGFNAREIFLWENEPNRTQADVLALVDRAIEIEESGK